MDKYYAFRKVLEFMDDNCDVKDATMNNYAGDIVVTGTSAEDGSTVTITVNIKKEGEKDGN